MIRKTIKDICDNLDKFVVDASPERGSYKIEMRYENVSIDIIPSHIKPPHIEMNREWFIDFRIGENISERLMPVDDPLVVGKVKIFRCHEGIRSTTLSENEIELIYKEIKDFRTKWIDFLGRYHNDTSPICLDTPHIQTI